MKNRRNIATLIFFTFFQIIYVTANGQKANSSQIEPLPKGWRPTGDARKDYKMGVDKKAGQKGVDAITIKSEADKIKGFGALANYIKIDKYLGKRIRMTGYMRSEKVDGWAGFWLRVDDSTSHDKRVLSFDNMYDKAIKETTDWTKCTLVLDVPKNGTTIVYGALLSGKGQIWFDDIKFDLVGGEVPVTRASR
ncbi:MAG TPA: hypothetical protein VN721_01730 [Flavipsychrobacter sp.]|nr:hypothetical protein [Flavipsychrobacter sp.]